MISWGIDYFVSLKLLRPTMKKLKLLAVASLLLSLHTVAQVSPHSDSLLRLLAAAREDTGKIRLYIRIGNEYQAKEPLTAGKYYLQALELSRQLAYPNGFFQAYPGYINILNHAGLSDSALIITQQAVALAKKENNAAELAIALFNTGINYINLREFENAVSFLEQGNDIFSRLGNAKFEGTVNDILQSLYMEMHQYRKAIHYGKEAVNKLSYTKSVDRLPNVLNNLGVNYTYLEKYDSANYYLEQAAALVQQSGDIMVDITLNLDFAYINLRTGHFDQLKPYLEKALALARINGFAEQEGLALYGLSEYYLARKEFNTARKYADSSLTIANRDNNRFIKLKLYPHLSVLAFAMNNSQMSIRYRVMYETLRDSILDESVTRNTINIEKKYETQKKESQLILQQAQLRQKSTVIYSLATMSVAILALLLFIYRNQKTRQKLQQLKIDELEREKQLTATEAVLKGEEQERSRLAKDLHDGLGGMLSGIKYSLSNFKEHLTMTHENAQTFERSIDMLDSSIKEMRRVAHNMMPEMLVKYGLNMALKEFCGEINRSGVVQVNFQSLGMEQFAIDQTSSVTIYRIVQELVNNAIKHSSATNILVQVHRIQTEHLLTITVEDDGIGFDKAILDTAKGIGWSNIKNRVDFLHGSIDVHSELNKGTSILVEIRYKATE